MKMTFIINLTNCYAMKGNRKMNETRTINIANSEIKTPTREDILDERVTKLEKAVFVEPTEASGLADEEVRIIILGNIDRKLYAKICTLCLSEDDVNVIYEKATKKKHVLAFKTKRKEKQNEQDID